MPTLSRRPSALELTGNLYQVAIEISSLTGEAEILRGARVRIVADGGMVGEYVVEVLDGADEIRALLDRNLDADAREWWTDDRIEEMLLGEEACLEYDLADLELVGSSEVDLLGQG